MAASWSPIDGWHECSVEHSLTARRDGTVTIIEWVVTHRPENAGCSC